MPLEFYELATMLFAASPKNVPGFNNGRTTDWVNVIKTYDRSKITIKGLYYTFLFLTASLPGHPDRLKPDHALFSEFLFFYKKARTSLKDPITMATWNLGLFSDKDDSLFRWNAKHNSRFFDFVMGLGDEDTQVVVSDMDTLSVENIDEKAEQKNRNKFEQWNVPQKHREQAKMDCLMMTLEEVLKKLKDCNLQLLADQLDTNVKNSAWRGDNVCLCLSSQQIVQPQIMRNHIFETMQKCLDVTEVEMEKEVFMMDISLDSGTQIVVCMPKPWAFFWSATDTKSKDREMMYYLYRARSYNVIAEAIFGDELPKKILVDVTYEVLEVLTKVFCCIPGNSQKSSVRSARQESALSLLRLLKAAISAFIVSSEDIFDGAYISENLFKGLYDTVSESFSSLIKKLKQWCEDVALDNGLLLQQEEIAEVLPEKTQEESKQLTNKRRRDSEDNSPRKNPKPAEEIVDPEGNEEIVSGPKITDPTGEEEGEREAEEEQQQQQQQPNKEEQSNKEEKDKEGNNNTELELKVSQLRFKEMLLILAELSKKSNASVLLQNFVERCLVKIVEKLKSPKLWQSNELEYRNTNSFSETSPWPTLFFIASHYLPGRIKGWTSFSPETKISTDFKPTTITTQKLAGNNELQGGFATTILRMNFNYSDINMSKEIFHPTPIDHYVLSLFEVGRPPANNLSNYRPMRRKEPNRLRTDRPPLRTDRPPLRTDRQERSGKLRSGKSESHKRHEQRVSRDYWEGKDWKASDSRIFVSGFARSWSFLDLRTKLNTKERFVTKVVPTANRLSAILSFGTKEEADSAMNEFHLKPIDGVRLFIKPGISISI